VERTHPDPADWRTLLMILDCHPGDVSLRLRGQYDHRYIPDGGCRPELSDRSQAFLDAMQTSDIFDLDLYRQ
jgi:hypothetical protein